MTVMDDFKTDWTKINGRISLFRYNYCHGKRNERECRLLRFCQENNLKVVNILFKDKLEIKEHIQRSIYKYNKKRNCGTPTLFYGAQTRY